MPTKVVLSHQRWENFVFGIGSSIVSAPAHPALRGIAAGARSEAWRQLRCWIARRQQRHALAELDDWLLRDVGVIRERDIGLSADAARREVELFWLP